MRKVLALLISLVVAALLAVPALGASHLHWKANAPMGVLQTLRTHSQGIRWTSCKAHGQRTIRCQGASSLGRVYESDVPISKTTARVTVVIASIGTHSTFKTRSLARWIAQHHKTYR